ncbi:hypothetical protein H2198_001287 [Neophaeococcomyces mojaviensis]|uniref:Uncharacterized protein n=1 Tax=Neophaeococcomyces mojaviensis TaxID=3383035 RepID=A0ACC3AHH2_9EURO|nr:hypothetical protein H2198_001287 [Knufia sp. JES_112]
MRWYGVFTISAIWATLLSSALSTFADEAYNIDFHHALLGIPQPRNTFFHRPDASANAALLYTLSDKAILGAVNPRDGSLVWRQTLAGQAQDNLTDGYLVAGEGDGKITTAFGETVAAWDAGDGRLIWSREIEENSKAIGLQAVPVLGISTDGAVQDVVLLTQSRTAGGGYTVSRLGGDSSADRWHYNDVDSRLDATVSIATSPKHVFYISTSSGIISGQKTKVVVIDITNGKPVKDYSVSLDAEAVSYDLRQVAASCSGSPFLITSDKPYKTLKFNLLGNTKVSTIMLEDKGEDIVSVQVHSACGANAAAHFLVHVSTLSKNWAEIYHIDTAKGDVIKAYSLPAIQESSTFAGSSNANSVFFTRVTDTQVSVHSSESHGNLGRWPRNEIGVGYRSSSKPVYAAAEVASREGTSTAVRVVVTSPEGSWYLIRNGDTQWSRPEMLAYTTVATWSDDIQADSLIQELETEISVDPATAYINRIYRHAQELMSLPHYLMELPQRILSPTADEISTRQTLVGSKSIILATSLRSLFSLSGVDGSIQWHADLSKSLISDVRSLTSHEGRVTLYTAQGSIVVVNATNGVLIEQKSGTIASSQLIELPGSPASTTIKVNEDGIPSYASDLAPSVPAEGNAIMTLGKDGEVLGWTVGSTITQTWSFKPKNARVISITSRPAHDPIASIGKVLGDRSVLYKYVSPNLALLTTLSTTTLKESLTIYLIDAITGTVLHSSTHFGILPCSPISAVLSENWLAYTFTSSDPETSAISAQLIISELYESSIPNDRGLLSARTNFSSFDPDAVHRPHVISQAYTLTEPIQNLTVTQTAQGITNRQLLAYLPHSNAIAAIPMHVLNARRPVDRDPNTGEAEEGLFRYQPTLESDPKFFLSHAREVVGIKQILTAPTLLESTSMIFAFGHDIFGTQVAPSQTFDVLGKSFKRIQLILTVVALYVGVIVIRPLVRRKVVERGWL